MDSNKISMFLSRTKIQHYSSLHINSFLLIQSNFRNEFGKWNLYENPQYFVVQILLKLGIQNFENALIGMWLMNIYLHSNPNEWEFLLTKEIIFKFWPISFTLNIVYDTYFCCIYFRAVHFLGVFNVLKYGK